jgi:nitrous oxide reductase accessory protein NosL
MKRFLLLLLAAGILATGCSRSDKPETSMKPQSTPDAARLKLDSERLQQATANAAREREKAAAAMASPSPTFTP